MPGDELEGIFDRDQILGGVAPARRAAALLFLIETRTARLVAQSRRQLERPLTEGVTQERGLEFVEAFALAREAALRPSAQDLERHAEGWSDLVPSNPRLRAALARRFGEQYRFADRVAPGIRKALGVDGPEVRSAFQDLFGEGIEVIFAPRLAVRERLRWTWARFARRLESLPPFWTAYSLTLTETIGASILALPIAFASLGPLPGIAIIIILGLVNVLTVSLMAEAVVRSGPMRYRNAFVGRLVESYLGPRGSVGVSVLLAIFSFVALPVYYVGLGSTLQDATSAPAWVWVAALFVVTLLFVRRGSLNATVATALVVGTVNLLLVLAIAALAVPHLRTANLMHAEMPFTGGGFDASIVGLVFGVVLMAYFGHLSAVICGSVVLKRDPGGRSLVRGSAAAQVTVIVLYCLFVLAVNGAVGAGGLRDATGTALGPLAGVAGPGVHVLGSAFVILALGMISIIESLSLVKLAQERIPSRAPRVILLPRRRGHLAFHARRNLRAGLTYLGPAAGGPRFSFDLERDGHLEHEELVISTRRELLGEGVGGRHRLDVEVIEADERRARVAVTSTLRMAYEGDLDSPGLDLAQTLLLSDGEAALMGALARDGDAAVAVVAARVGRSELETRSMLDALVAQGLVTEKQTPSGRLYSVHMASRRARSSAAWDVLTNGPQAATAATEARRTDGSPDRWLLALGRSGRFVLSVVPLVAAFALGEWFLLAGAGSFVRLLSFLGVIVVSLLGGLYPVLLFVSSRRKGEYPSGIRSALLGRPVVLGAVYLLFLAALFAHGIVIWQDPVERAGALIAGVALLAIPIMLARGGAFLPRLTIELRDDRRSGSARFAFLSGGRPVAGTVTLEYPEGEQQREGPAGELPAFDSLRRVLFEVHRDGATPLGEVKVWAHRVTEEGDSESLPAVARLSGTGDVRAVDLSLSRGEAVFPVGDTDLAVEIELKELSS